MFCYETALKLHLWSRLAYTLLGQAGDQGGAGMASALKAPEHDAPSVVRDSFCAPQGGSALALLLVCALPQLALAQQCPDDWEQAEEHCAWAAFEVAHAGPLAALCWQVLSDGCSIVSARLLLHCSEPAGIPCA